MQKLGYTKTSWDKGGAVFTFADQGNSYAIRLAGNPVLLLEHYYVWKGGTEFMKNYKLIKNFESEKVSKQNLKIIVEAKKFCEDFLEVVKLIDKSNKSTFVIYGEDKKVL